ncbi:hypothetical protein TNCV_1600741 [Trichonephila clavipes]|nr:hypothetical protein TNCV_1600741 [Trichonephila clavipes]
MPVSKHHYRIGQLHDALKRFCRVGVRQRICNGTQDGPLFLKIRLITFRYNVDVLSQGLFVEVVLSHQKGWHITKECINATKIAARWVPHQLTEARKLHQYPLAGIRQKRYRNESDRFLQCIVAIDET